MQRTFLALAAIVFLPSLLIAGEYNKVLSIGDHGPDWKDLEATDGRKHTLAEFADKDVVVLVFTCNSCPYATDHEGRLSALHAQLKESGKGVVIAINPNQIKEDLLPAMKTRADARGLKYFYLQDATQA